MPSISLLAPLILVASLAQGQVSPFNGLRVPPPDSTGSYRLLIGGHFHGSSSNLSGFPAASLLANLDSLNGLGAHVLLSTGDLFLNADRDGERYKQVLFDRLQVPLFNAPGNHDVEGKAYRANYGETHTLITMGNDRIVLLDTERDNGSIKGEQLEFLKKAATDLAGRLFIVTHRPVWAEGDATYSPLFKGNTRSLRPTNFKPDIWPLLESIAERNPVLWISGSMSGMAPASIFLQTHAPNITYIQCALRDVPRDAMLIADVNSEGITWSAWSLTGQQLEAPTIYDAQWWAANMKQEPAFKWRLLPYHIKQIVSHRAFWWGLVVGVLVLFGSRKLVRRLL